MTECSDRPTILPKLALYAHPEVIRTLRVLAAEDGVMVQSILRRAVADYLAARGHCFADLVSGT